MRNTFSQQLLAWFDQHGRHDLPWQQGINPYRVWVSEIMLQQTQVSTVIPYFIRFMTSFPDVTTLANANIDDILHHWSGLGYYARGRHLHQAAQMIMTEFNGDFPDSLEALQQLPGIGRSTAGAILAISMQMSAPILDGNVKRVLARYHAIDGWPGKTAVSTHLWEIATQYTPHDRVADYTQAIMDLGATLCTRSKPSCEDCPLQPECQGYQSGTPTQFPGKKPKKTLPVRSTYVLILITSTGEVMLERRPSNGIWGGLWSLPECQHTDNLANVILQAYQTKIQEVTHLTPFRHTFSHYHLDIHPIKVQIQQRPLRTGKSDTLIWYPPHNPPNIGLPQPITKLLTQIQQQISLAAPSDAA